LPSKQEGKDKRVVEESSREEEDEDEDEDITE
jgi:hypothetical protein